MPPRILIHQYFILKLRQIILNTDSDPKNTDRDPNIRVIAILEYSDLVMKKRKVKCKLVDHYKIIFIYYEV